MYPEGVLTKSRKGEMQVRSLIDKGRFVRYNYKDPKTRKLLEKGKVSLVIKNSRGKVEHFYMIPIKGNRYLVIPIKDKKKRKVWDRKKAVKLF